MDGIDAAIIRTNGGHEVLSPLGHIHLEYSPQFQFKLKAVEHAIRNSANDLAKSHNNNPAEIVNLASFHFSRYWRSFCELNNNLDQSLNQSLEAIIEESTDLHINAAQQVIKACKLHVKDIALIGYHGQTFYHNPGRKLSIILGNYHRMALTTGINTVCDFRIQDIIQGGQGAPLAPIYHFAVARKMGITPCAIINCGGISNISYVPNDNELELMGFDCGPGNALLDQFIKIKTNNNFTMDQDGVFSLSGHLHQEALATLREAALPSGFATRAAPKSLDVGDLVLPKSILNLRIEDGANTLAYFTAQMIVEALVNLPHSHLMKGIVLAGGGWRNPTILKYFQELAGEHLSAELNIRTADEVGFSASAMEAELMAFLAVRCQLNLPISFPLTTGAPQPLTGGLIIAAA